MITPAARDSTTRGRSTFVTVVAWIFIVVSGFGTFVSALQNILIRQMPLKQMVAALSESKPPSTIPFVDRFVFEHIELIVLAFFLTFLLMLVASIGLLQRRNWGRLLSMGALGIGIVYMVAVLIFQQFMLSSSDAPFAGWANGDPMSQQNARALVMMKLVMQIASIVFCLAWAGLFGWIVVKLRSPEIRAEFVSASRDNTGA